jgi:hypothetical protein
MIHESIDIPPEQAEPLIHPILHDTWPTLEIMLKKINLYSTLSAQSLHKKNKKTSLSLAILKGFWAFFRSYVLKMGFLDRKLGFIIAIAIAQASYYKQIKLLLLDEQVSNNRYAGSP